MKKIFLTLALLLTVSFSMVIFSCSNSQEPLVDLQSKALTIEDYFEKVINTNIDIKKEHILYINYTWNPINKTIKVINSIEKEPDFFVLQSAPLNKSNSIQAKQYTVECNKGTSTWTKVCDGRFSCGTLINDCLNQGGCATICKKQMAYVPQTNTFYLID